MSLLSKTRVLFAALFFTGIVCASAWNIYAQGPGILDGLSQTGIPRSPDDVRQACARLQGLVAQKLEGKYEAWEAYTQIQMALGKSEMNDFSVIKAENGRLYRGGLYPLHSEQAKKLALDIAALAEAAEEKGVKLLYMNTPDTIIKGAEPRPDAMPYRDYNTASNVLLNTLREKGIPCLDTRYSLLAQGFAPEAVSPRSSFLLTGEAAFAIFGYLLEGLDQNFKLSLDPEGFYRNISNYSLKQYPEFFMGELGKETGPQFSGLADFTSVSPGFETDFIYEATDMFGKSTWVEGDAVSTLLHPDALIYYENLYRLYPQSYYKHTNTTWSRTVNTRKPDGPKVLVIHDYYTAQVISHLAPLCGELHTLAYQENLSTNATEYLKNNEIDYVIISFFPQNLVRPEMQSLIAGAE